MYKIKNIHLLIISAAFLAVMLAVPYANGGKAVLTSALPRGEKNRPVIIIDPGHGGVDGGAVGSGGTVEKRVNLEIALRLRDVLDAAGFTVIMTRDSDISIHDSSAQSIKQQKVSDLRNRLALTRLYPDSLLVSIHQNTLPDSKSVSGAQVFFSPNDPGSAVLAQAIQDSFNSGLQPGSARTIKKAGKNLYLFYNAENVAVLTECGFLSNPEEERLLCSPEYQDKIVFCIYRGILEYLDGGETVRSSGDLPDAQ